ncbi:LPA, partial [Branchiostoma lanceolatum]
CRIYAEFEPKDLSGKMCESEELKDVRLTDIHDKIRSELKHQPAGNEDVLPPAVSNIARGKPAFQSTVAWDMGADRAVDGNTNTNYFANSCQHNSHEDNPSWWVDLGKSFTINRVVIFNRQDCCSDRINPFNVHIGDSDQVNSNPKCGGDHKIDVNQPSISITCQGMKGRYVGVRLPGYSRSLTLCEVQVFSEPLPSTEMKKEQLYEQLYDLLKQEKQKTREQDETISTLQAKINDETPTDSNSFPGKPALPLQPCPDGYSQYNTKCYKLSTDKMTFSAAKDVCQRDGGILAIINAQDTSDPVVKKIRADGGPYWIGLTDVRKEGTFVRSDEAESPAAYTNWYPHQPDNGGGEDCVAMSRDQDWNDVPCSSRLNFICEKARTRRWICPALYPLGYKKRCFRFSTGNVNFNKAKAICRGEGGRLAVLQDEGTDIFIRKSIRRLPHRRAQSYWIGLSDAQKEGTFVWSDGTELTTSAYAHWAPGNPDNAAVGDGEDCVEVRPDLDYKWNDVGCGEKRRFGCEKDVAPGSDQTMLMTEMPPAGTESPNNPGHEQPHTTSGPDEDGCTWLDQELHEKERELQEQAQIITELTAHLLQKDEEIQDLTIRLQQKDEEIQDVRSQLQQKDEEIQDVTTLLQQKDEEIQDVTTLLQQKDEEIQDVTALLQQKDEEIQDVTALLQQKDEEIQDVTALLQQKDEEIQDVRSQLQQKDEEIQVVTSQLQQKDDEIQDVTSQLQQKDEEIQDVISQLQQKDEEIQDFISQFRLMDEEIQDFIFLLQQKDEEIQDLTTRLEQPSPAADHETPVTSTGVNVALGKTAFQTSTLAYRGAASLAVDGNSAANYHAGSCTHTAHMPGEDTPSWWVDLGQSYVVDRVVIFNRQDCCSDRINPFNVHIGDSDQVNSNPKCGGDHQINVNQPSISISCQGMKGRYVGVRLPGPLRVLTLCEVQVFSAHIVPEGKWRNDFRCGQGYPAENGYPAECNPDGEGPCCSTANWCGKTRNHCGCKGCADYRDVNGTATGSESRDYTSLGCWRDTADRAIPTLEGTDPRLDGNYQVRPNAIETCYQVARSLGFTVFAVQDGGQCFGSADAHYTHSKYGPSTACAADGEGGPRANEVYGITATGPDVRATSCHEAKGMNPTGGDGEYTIYPFTTCTDVSIRVYCHNMASGNPEEFLTLPSGPENNYAIVFADRLRDGHLCDGPLQDQNAGSGTTKFSKVRIKFEDTTIAVVRDDYTFATSTGYNNVSYAEAGDCYSWSQGCAKGTFKVNLDGTELALAPQVDWVMVNTWPGDLTINDMFISEDRTVASARCGGWCGRCRPAESKLRLLHPQCHGQIGTESLSEEEEIQDLTPPLEQPPPVVQTTVTSSKENCIEGNGASYRGPVSVTETGKMCQRWDRQTPHGHTRGPVYYPSSGLEQNYCRNPDGEAGVWCYTTDPNTRWERCDVPTCESLSGEKIQDVTTPLDQPRAQPAVQTTMTSSEAPATTEVSVPTVERTRCLGSIGYCPGSHATGARCVDGFCECSSTHYQRYTCLPVVGSCATTRGSPVAQAEAFQTADPRETFSCVADDNSQYEVHVLAVYEGVGHTRGFQQDPTGTAEMDVYVRAGQLTKPLVLVLSSYEAVNWVLHLPEVIEVHKVLLMAYYVDQSDVTVRGGSVDDVQRLSGRTGGVPACAYGKDDGGCKTVELLEFINGEFGPVSSLTGTYKADEWNLKVGTSTLETTTTMAPTSMAPTTTAMAPTTTETTSSTMAITTTVAKTMTSPGNGPIITPTETSSACEGKTLQLSCSAGETLEIDSANFGRTSKSHRCNCGLFCNTINTCYADNSLSIVKSACQGKRECAVEATKSVFGDPCPFIGKYLEATYCCVPG